MKSFLEEVKLSLLLLFSPRVRRTYKFFFVAGLFLYIVWPFDLIPDFTANPGLICLWPLTLLDDVLIMFIMCVIFNNISPLPEAQRLRARIRFRAGAHDSSPEILSNWDFRHPGEIRALARLLLPVPLIPLMLCTTISVFLSLPGELLLTLVDLFLLYIFFHGFRNLQRAEARELEKRRWMQANDYIYTLGAERMLGAVRKNLKSLLDFPGAKITILVDPSQVVPDRSDQPLGQIMGVNPYCLTIHHSHFPNVKESTWFPMAIYPIAHEVGHISHARVNHLFSVSEIDRWPANLFKFAFISWRYHIELSADRIMLLGSGGDMQAIAGYFCEYYAEYEGWDASMLLRQAACLPREIPFSEVRCGYPSSMRRIQQMLAWEKEMQAIEK
jgi:uncharacterized membrane protein YkvA (DUF1232 family)